MDAKNLVKAVDMAKMLLLLELGEDVDHPTKEVLLLDAMVDKHEVTCQMMLAVKRDGVYRLTSVKYDVGIKMSTPQMEVPTEDQLENMECWAHPHSCEKAA